MEQKLKEILDVIVNSGIKILLALVFLWLGFKLIQIITKALSRNRLFKKIDKSLQSFLMSFIKATAKILLIVMIAGFLGFPMASIITVLGSAAVAVGLALQGGLSNLAGGVMILFFKPFKIGDYIDTSSGSGNVTEISLFYTTLLTLDNRVILIPNGSIINNSLINYSKMGERRLDLNISVDYSTDIEKFKKVVTEILAKDERILKDRDLFVRLNEMADSSLNFVIRVWVKTEDYWNVNFDLKEKIKNALDKNHIVIPFPQMDVHMK